MKSSLLDIHVLYTSVAFHEVRIALSGMDFVKSREITSQSVTYWLLLAVTLYNVQIFNLKVKMRHTKVNNFKSFKSFIYMYLCMNNKCPIQNDFKFEKLNNFP